MVSRLGRTQGEKDNWLQNGSFADHLAHWEHDAGTSLYTVGDDYVQANVGALSVRGEGACWVSDGGHPACYIRNSHLIQRCADYASVPSLQTDGEGKKLPVPVRLVLYYQAVGFCHLTISFDDEQKSGEYAGYTSLLYDQDVAADSGYHMLEVTGLWNGTGDLDISVDDGPALIRSVSLWLDEYTYYESRIEQTARSIRLSVTELSQTVAGHTTSIGQLEIRADSIESSVSSIRETAEGNSTAIATLTQTAEGLSSDVRSLQSTQGTHTSQISSIQQTASAISTRVSAIEGDYVTGSDLTQTANRLSAKISEVSEGREGRNLLPNSLINETSTLYGFGRRSLRLKAGETYTLSACGLVPYAAYSDGMELQVHIWRVADANDVLESGEEKGVSWRNSRNVHIEYNEGLSMTRDTNSGYESAWVADRTGEYFIEGYMAYKNGAANGGSRTHGVTLLWVKVEQGASATGWVAGADDAVNLVNWIASPLAVNSVVGETGCGTQSAVSEAPFGQVVQIEHYANSHWQRRFERRAGYSQLTGRAVTFWMVCRSLDGYGRWVTDSDGTERRVRLCFGDVNKVDTIDSWTSDFTDLGGGWRKYWCVRYMDEDLGATVGLCHTMGRWRVYAVGIVSGCVCPGIRDIMEQNGLLSTGIDIEKKQVTVTADNFKVRNNAGVETMLVDANGKLSASLIEAVQIVTQALQSGVITAGEAIVRDLKVGGNAEFAGVVRATTFYRSLEIGTSINAVWKYTFSDGSYELTAYKEWDIGETWDVVDGVSRVIVKIEYWGNRGTDIFYARTEGQVVSIPDPEESEGRTIEIYNSSGGSIVVHASNAKACTTTIDGWGGSRSGLFIFASSVNAFAGDLTGSMGYLRLHAGWRTESGSSVPMLYWNILEYRNTDGTLYTP